jgi:hypothetical protein
MTPLSHLFVASHRDAPGRFVKSVVARIFYTDDEETRKISKKSTCTFFRPIDVFRELKFIAADQPAQARALLKPFAAVFPFVEVLFTMATAVLMMW